MQNVITSAENIFTWLQPATWIFVAAALIGCGLAMLIGGQEGREKAKKWIPYIFAGCIIILLAVGIAKEIVTKIAL